MEFELNSIEEALEDIKNGKVIIVVDDEDRENEETSLRLQKCYSRFNQLRHMEEDLSVRL